MNQYMETLEELIKVLLIKNVLTMLNKKNNLGVEMETAIQVKEIGVIKIVMYKNQKEDLKEKEKTLLIVNVKMDVIKNVVIKTQIV